MKNFIIKKLVYFSNVSVSACHPITSHVVPYYDLTFVLEGTMTYKIDRKTYVLKKNDAIFLAPGSQRERLAGTSPVKYVSFNFHLDESYPVKTIPFIENAVNSTVKKLLTTYPFVTILPTFHSSQKITSILNCILFELIDMIDLKSNNEHILNIYKYIAVNIGKKISLEDISRELHLSREYLARIFKQHTNKTINEYITEQKMLLAKEMIANQNMPLSSVSEQLGFDDYSYFSKSFKKYFKTTPNALKKNNYLN